MRIPLDLPPGLNGDDTSFAGGGRWADGSNVRFRLGRPQTIGGWESLTGQALAGVCRAIFPWTDNAAVLNIAFGTHGGLQLWRRSEEHTSELQSLMRSSYAVFCLKKKKKKAHMRKIL